MPSPIERMIDSVMQCVRCGAPMGKCGCWDQVKLHCPGCGRTKKATRELDDPPGAKVIELMCPKCWADDLGQPLR